MLDWDNWQWLGSIAIEEEQEGKKGNVHFHLNKAFALLLLNGVSLLFTAYLCCAFKDSSLFYRVGVFFPLAFSLLLTGILLYRAMGKLGRLKVKLSSNIICLTVFVAWVVFLFFKHPSLWVQKTSAILALALPFIAWCGFDIYQYVLKIKREKATQNAEEKKLALRESINPNRMYDRLGADPISLIVGGNLLALVDPEVGGEVLGKIVSLRQHLTDTLGYVIPNIRILDSTLLEKNAFEIRIRDAILLKGVIYPQHRLFLFETPYGHRVSYAEQDFELLTRCSDRKEESFEIREIKTNSVWLPNDKLTKTLQEQNTNALSDAEVFIYFLSDTVQLHVDALFGFSDIQCLLALVRQHSEELVDGLIPAQLSIWDLRRILVTLLEESVPIKDIGYIIERLSDYSRTEKNPYVLAEKLRFDLRRSIIKTLLSLEKPLKLLTLSKECEAYLMPYLNTTEQPYLLGLPAEEANRFKESVELQVKAVIEPVGYPVLVCSSLLRRPLNTLLERYAVLSHEEVILSDEVEEAGNINLPQA